MAKRQGAAARAWHEVVAILSAVLAHELTQLAAALTYYTVLSLLPALIVVVSLLGVVGLSPDAVHSLLDTLGELGAPWAAQAVSAVLDSILTSQRSGLVLVGSLVPLALGGLGVRRLVHGGLGQDLRDHAAAAVLEEPPAARRPRAAAAGAALGDGGRRRARRALRPLGRRTPPASAPGRSTSGRGSSGRCSSCSASCSSRCCTSSRRAGASRRSWWLLPGAAAGVALWIAASAGFSLYLDHFASYNRVYGTLGAAVAFLVWAWLMNLALLVGVEVNREVESRRERAGRRRRPPQAARSPRAYNRGSRQPARASRPSPTTSVTPCPTSPPSSRSSAASPPSGTSSSSPTTTSAPRCRTPPTTPATPSSSRASPRRTRTR